MKIAPVLLGAVFAQESGDYSDYEAPVTGGEDRWDSWGSDNNFLMGTGERAYGSTQTVQAVTCWESNNMGDLRHYNTQNDDGFGWSNVHHGHDQAADSNIVTGDESDYQIGTVYIDHGNTNKVDQHSAEAFDNRYSGCIYEVDGWTYSSTTYNKKFEVAYGWDGTTHNAGGFDTSFTSHIRINWWHYFNAHVFAGGNAQTHYIAMANPQYEGLGYLNFIATFAKKPTADTFANNKFYSARQHFNHNVEDTVTDNYSAGGAFEVRPGTSTAEEWYSTYGGTDAWTEQAALSSFPHNDLGKDFRFNVRVLHRGGDGDPTNAAGKDSYYFYKINEITIVFPYDVRCPKESSHVTSDGQSDTFRCMDSANYNGHRGWYNNQTNDHATAAKNENLPFYIETLNGGSASAGFCAGGATARSDGEWYQCGKTYNVKGLLNTYDEAAQKEFGTHQEFWFQFYYHFELTTRTSAAIGTPTIDSSTTSFVHYNYPNLLFNAFEVTSVDFKCSNTNANHVYNSNGC
jgi:hypothetical protein